MIKKLAPYLWNETVVSIMLSATMFCLYITTMCRSVGFTDSGELAAVACTLGIAHPTGYPLFTLLGRCWMLIPSAMEEIVRLNVLTAALTAAAVGIFFKTMLAIHRAVTLFPLKNRKRKDLDERRFFHASIVSTLMMGGTTTFWSQSTAVEVYALHLVLVLLTLWCFVDGLEEQLAEPRFIARKFMLFAFILGLSFSNHMTTILLAPGFLWLYFRVFGFSRESFLRILKVAVFFLLGLSVYLYLPVRSASHPLLDWGHPATPERFFSHVSGKQFRVWMFSGWDVVQKQFNYYAAHFTSEFNYPSIICIIAGLAVLFKRSHRLLMFFALLFGATILYSVNYDIFDIDSYFLLSYMVLGFVIGHGVYSFMQRAAETSSWSKIILTIVFCALPVAQIVEHWKKVDETGNTYPRRFIEKAFSELEPNAIVLASQWDYFVSPSLYYQTVRHERSDVTVVDKSLLQNRSWYFLQLESHAPWLMERIQPSARLFLTELNKFEHDVPFRFESIQSRWQNLLFQIVEQSMPDHPVYIDARIDQEIPPQYHRTPAGLFLRLSQKEDTAKYLSAVTQFPVWKTDLPAAQDLIRYYCTMLLRDALWLAQRGEKESAKKIATEVLGIDPGNIEAAWIVQQIDKKNKF